MRQKPTPISLSENVQLKEPIYHIVAYVNNEFMEMGNYEAGRSNLHPNRFFE